jgi:hypothetical protein
MEVFMEVLRYFQKIESGKIIIENLEQFSGMDVEIVIIPVQKQVPVLKPEKSARGSLKHYANPDLIHKEKSAWIKAVKEKYNDL